MKKILIILLAALMGSYMPATARELKSISRERLMDKIKGAWAGQAIGCTYGGPTEFHYQGKMIPDETEIPWPEHYLQWYFDHQPGLYDDLYMEITFLDILHKYGINVHVDSVANAFAHADFPLWHANQGARYNLLNGIKAPKSGNWKYNPHADDIDYQIEADYAGVISPGMPNCASKISDKIGHIMNYGDGWYGGIYVGAMYATAYLYEDVETVVTRALKAIPEKSKFHQAITDVILWYHQHPNDWKKTWQLCQDKWANEVGCPDGVIGSFDIDALLNSAYITIGLLYGQGDFSRTLEIATRCGQDSDCNPSSAGGVLGCILGYSQIPEKWLQNVREVEDRDYAYTHISLNLAAQYSLDLALGQIKKQGGKVEGSNILIPKQEVKTVKFEQSFPGLKVVEVRKGRSLADFGEEKFTGCGLVMTGGVKSDDQHYIAQLEIYVDGKLKQKLNAPANSHDRAQEMCMIYDLKQGDHTLTIRWINPKDGTSVQGGRMVIYGKD